MPRPRSECRRRGAAQHRVEVSEPPRRILELEGHPAQLVSGIITLLGLRIVLVGKEQDGLRVVLAIQPYQRLAKPVARLADQSPIGRALNRLLEGVAGPLVVAALEAG